MLLSVDSPAAAFEIRDKLIRGVLQPSAIDFISLRAAAELGFKKALLAVEFGGNPAVIERCRLEMSQWCEAVELTEEEAGRFWNRIHNFTPMFLEKFGGGVMVRISTTLSDMREAIESLERSGDRARSIGSDLRLLQSAVLGGEVDGGQPEMDFGD